MRAFRSLILATGLVIASSAAHAAVRVYVTAGPSGPAYYDAGGYASNWIPAYYDDYGNYYPGRWVEGRRDDARRQHEWREHELREQRDREREQQRNWDRDRHHDRDDRHHDRDDDDR